MRRPIFVSLAVAGAIASVLLAIPAAAVVPFAVERVSISSSGFGGSGDSYGQSVSATGTYVAFASHVPTFVDDDTNGMMDVFVRNRDTGQTTRASVQTGGAQANYGSMSPSISSDGRYVAFMSAATNMVPDDTNGAEDIFVRDLQSGETTRVSVATGGGQSAEGAGSPSICADGRHVVFQASGNDLVADDTAAFWDVFIRDIVSKETFRVSVSATGTQANNHSMEPVISADGLHVAFYSIATNLVAGEDTNGVGDIFVRDLPDGTVTRVSVAHDGGQSNGWSESPSISGDGRYVAFKSTATNLVDGDTNGNGDIFVYDCLLGTTERVNVSTYGEQADYDAMFPTISSDGRYVAFASEATNLVSDDANTTQRDIFVRDRLARTTRLVSWAAGGAGANGSSGSYAPSAFSGDGRYIAFDSGASNFLSGDTNVARDVYLADRGAVTDVTAPHTDSDRVAYYANTATVHLTPTDNVGGSGVVHTYWRLNGGAATESTTATAFGTGAYTLDYWSSDWEGNVEPTQTVSFTVLTPPATNGTPSTPGAIATLKHGKSFGVSGYVIKHTAGTSPVTLQFYRLEKGKWKLRKTVTAKVSTLLTFSKYSKTTSVSLSGKWRVRARHKVGSKYRYSGYRTFTAS